MYCRTMEQLKEGLAEMEVDDGVERRQEQQQGEQQVEASVTVGGSGGETGGGGVIESMKKKLGELRRRIGERLLMRSKVSGDIRIVGEKEKQTEEEEVVSLDEVVGVSDEVELDVEEGVEAVEMEKEDTGSVSSKGLGVGYAFLDAIEEDKRDEECERKWESNRKRKSEDRDRMLKVKGLKVMPGWGERAKESRENPVWYRTVEREETGKVVKERKKIPLPEEYDLGLDCRGMGLNSSNRKNTYFGNNRKPLVGKEKGRGEKVNWLANFTRSGCIGCRGEDGNLNHSGRSGEPLVLIVGDEAVPSAVGFTSKGKKVECSWVLKKEHLRLEEVAKLLGRINQEKKEWDRECGRKCHEYFIPNGSKVLVGSYTHLRKEGLEGYVNDFNNMVRDVWIAMGDIGVEVLPVVPTVFEGLDEEGGKLLAGVKNWVEWVAEVKGRESIRELACTGGVETGWRESSCLIYRPCFASMTRKESVKEGEVKEWLNRGNKIEMIRGEKKEVMLRSLQPSKEIRKLLESKGRFGEEEEYEQKRRSSFERGVSVEAEFVFTNAVSKFTREAVKEGSYNGIVVGNVKEQLLARAHLEEKGSGKTSVLVVGGSQMGRIAGEMERIGGEVISVHKMQKIPGEWTLGKLEELKEKMMEDEFVPDKVVIGGPSNSIMRHGPESHRGFGPETVWKMEEARRGGPKDRMKCVYHMTEPVKISILERSKLVKMVDDLVNFIEFNLPTVKVVYVEMFPRFVERCCRRDGHMSEDDAWVCDNNRREVEREIRMKLNGRCEVVRWFEGAGVEKEPELEQIRRMGVVGADGVHLTGEMCKRTAVYFCSRLSEKEVVLEGEGPAMKKSRRW